MIYDIEADYKKYMESLIRHDSLQNNLRASSIGFACDRKHWYDLTERRKGVDVGLQSIFEEGKYLEKVVEKQLTEMGYELNDRQKEHRLEKPLITAHIEGELRKDGGSWVPYDIKSIAQWDFDSLASAEDFIHSKKPHQRNYAAQLLTYMLSTNREYGCLVLKNKQTGWIKPIWFSFNEHVSILDEAIKRAERVYAAKEKKEPPARTDDRSLCNRCDWKDICLPDLLANGGVGFIDSEHLRDQLHRREELKVSAEEFEDIDTEVKKIIKETGVGEKTCGDFLLTVKDRKTTRKVPITFTEETTQYMVVTITPIGGKK